MLFIAFVVRLYRVLMFFYDGRGRLPHAVLASGVAVGLAFALSFVFTAIAAYHGKTGIDLQVLRTFYPLGGLTFHLLMSAATIAFLGAAAAAVLKLRPCRGTSLSLVFP